MTISNFQNRILHQLLSATGLMERKADLVAAFTQGRTESSKEMLMGEAAELINHLKGMNNKVEAANQMRRKILAMCHRIHWTIETTRPDGTEYKAVDMDRLNGWCLHKSYLKKKLNDFKYEELPKLVSEFQQVYKYYLAKVAG